MTSRHAAAVALAGCVVVVIAGVASSAVPAEARVGAVPASQRLTVQVWLKPDLAGADTARSLAWITTGLPFAPAVRYRLRRTPNTDCTLDTDPDAET